jgi:exopolysaccharide production protein ExoQ
LTEPDDHSAEMPLAGRAASLLLAGFLAACLIGERPFAVEAADKAAISASGSAFNRLLLVGALAAALPLLLVRLGAVAGLLGRNALGGALVLWSLASFAWASHPDLAIRRGVAFALAYLTLAVLAAAGRSSLGALRGLAGVFGLITVLNLGTMVALPAASHSAIGENGIFADKNSAGTMALLAVVALGGACCAARRTPARLGLGLVWLLAWLFLVMTRSRTSLGLAAAVTLLGPCLDALLRAGPGWRALAWLAGLTGGFAALVVGSAAGVGEGDLRLALFGDLTFSLRTEIWAPVVREIAARPWQGHGFGSFWDTGAVRNPLPSAPWNAFFLDPQIINTAHNGYLDVLLQTGLVGFALACGAILRCLWLLQATAGSATDRGERIALVTCLCLALALALNNLLESYLFRPGDPIGYLFLFLMLHAERSAMPPARRPRPLPLHARLPRRRPVQG